MYYLYTMEQSALRTRVSCSYGATTARARDSKHQSNHSRAKPAAGSEKLMWHKMICLLFPAGTRRNNNDIMTSFWRHNDVIFASCVCWVIAQIDMLKVYDIKAIRHLASRYTILRPSYHLHNGISYTGKTTSLYWIGAIIIPNDQTKIYQILVCPLIRELA